MDFELTKEEWVRYDRHLILNEFSVESQRKLKKSKILCVGAGGLANAALPILVGSGIGEIGIVDYDTVELTNLHRQFLFSTQDIGKMKTDVAKERLEQLNNNTKIITYQLSLNETNIEDIISNYDLVIDATDNYYIRYIINDCCMKKSIPICYGSVVQFEGQVTSFMKDGPCLRCLFPEPPPNELIGSCNTSGVFPSMPSVIGNLQATEAVKILLGIGNTLSGRLLVINGLRMEFKEFQIEKDPNCPICANKRMNSIETTELPCGNDVEKNKHPLITSEELLKLKKSGVDDPLLIDVRSENEFQAYNIGGVNIPLNELEGNISEIPRGRRIIVCCKSGLRSKSALEILMKHGFLNASYLKGGVLSYIGIEAKMKHD